MENCKLPNYKNETSLAVLQLCQTLAAQRGVYSSIHLQAAGFRYTSNGSTARCDDCGLEESNWTKDIKPFSIHLQRSPACSFVRSMLRNSSPAAQKSNITTESSSMLNNNEVIETHQSSVLIELESLKQVRSRTFSHWPHRTTPSSAQMIQAGFFSCNVGDRVICIYCNLICQQWTPNIDDPCEVHQILSPKCPYVISMTHTSPTTATLNSNSLQMFLNFKRTAVHKNYAEPKKRRESFLLYPDDNISSIDQLVTAGFFYTGTKNTITCFYCDGSLQNWGANDNPIIEHARWFPHCAYARQLCGVETYQRILDSRRNDEKLGKTKNSIYSFGTLLPPSNDDIGRFAAARLDLPVSRRLVVLRFELSIIKRCWEDQLRLNRSANPSDLDLFMACTIVHKQIELISVNKDNITIPFLAVKRIHDETGTDTSGIVSVVKSSDKNFCLLCFKEEKRMACIPCAHLAACISCSYILRTCPICHRAIEAFVRIYQ